MAFTVAGAALDPHNGLATDGLICDAFNEETWFPSSSPVANTPEPGTPDATDTSGLLGASGVAGQFLITTPKSGSYWIATYNSWDPTVIAWVKAITHPHTNLAGWTNVSSILSSGQTTIAVGSNGVALPTGTINVANSGAFNSATWPRYALILVSAGNYQPITYTGVGTGTLTGCSGGTGTLATGQGVYVATVAALYRRFVSITAFCAGGPTLASRATVTPISTINGNTFALAAVGILQSAGLSEKGNFGAAFPCDPSGYYAFQTILSGSGSVTSISGTYVDF
jgi:hypothetical protein